jgi:hypothetical protein
LEGETSEPPAGIEVVDFMVAFPKSPLKKPWSTLMPITARTCAFAILALTVTLSTALAETARWTKQAPNGMMLCRVPVTKCYQIRPEFCPQQIVALIRQSVPGDGSCDCCGPYGVPPIFAAGNNIVIRNSAEAHDRIAKFLNDMGVTAPITVGTP